jgi:hypothetical protein
MKAKKQNSIESSIQGETYRSPDKISEQEVKQALLRSGYLLEHRVEALLRHDDWYVEANGAYHDSETNKSRELDIFALKLVSFSGETGDAVFCSVVAECVNNSQPLALITKSENYSAQFADDIKFMLDPREIRTPGKAPVPVPAFLGLNKFHHYCDGKIATQFCSFARKDKGKPNSEWMALHEGNQFESFLTLIKALEHKLTTFTSYEGKQLRAEFMYMLLILQGELLDIRLSDSDLTVVPVSHEKYRRSVIWNGAEENYIIDVVTEAALPELLKQIYEEATLIGRAIASNAEQLRGNIVLKESTSKPE